MRIEIAIVVGEDGNLGVRSNADKPTTLGYMEIAKAALLQPPKEPAVVTAPAGALRVLNGERPHP